MIGNHPCGGVPHSWREKAEFFLQLQQKRRNETGHNKMIEKRDFINLMLPGLREDIKRRTQRRINNNAIEAMGLGLILFAWQAYAHQLATVRRKLRVHFRRGLAKVFNLWRVYYVRQKSALYMLMIVGRSFTRRSFYRLKSHMRFQVQRESRNELRVKFSLWYWYHTRFRLVLSALRSSSIPSCIEPLRAWKLFVARCRSTRRHVFRRMQHRKWSCFIQWHNRSARRTRSLSVRLNVFNRFLRCTQKTRAFVVWCELHYHKACKVLQKYARRRSALKKFPALKVRAKEAHAERERTGFICRNGMILACLYHFHNVFETCTAHTKRYNKRLVKPILREIRKRCKSFMMENYGRYLFNLYDVLEIGKIDEDAFLKIRNELLKGERARRVDLGQVRIVEQECRYGYECVVLKEDYNSWLSAASKRMGDLHGYLYRRHRMRGGDVVKVWMKYAVPKVFREKAEQAATVDLFVHRKEYVPPFACLFCGRGHALYRDHLQHQRRCLNGPNGVPWTLSGYSQTILERLSNLPLPAEIIFRRRRDFQIARKTGI